MGVNDYIILLVWFKHETYIQIHNFVSY